MATVRSEEVNLRKTELKALQAQINPHFLYNPQLGAAISLVMMVIVLVCMLVMNRFGEGEEQAVIL